MFYPINNIDFCSYVFILQATRFKQVGTAATQSWEKQVKDVKDEDIKWLHTAFLKTCQLSDLKNMKDFKKTNVLGILHSGDT